MNHGIKTSTARRMAAATLVTAAAGGLALLAPGAAYASTTSSFSYAGCTATLTVSGTNASSHFVNGNTYVGSKGEVTCEMYQERHTSSSASWSDATGLISLGPGSSYTTGSYAVEYETRDCITYSESGTSNKGTECGNDTL